ncbi:MAG: hypothetical protein GTO45_25365 [Candidatus Aminicenantes bacterium]|nr:hypothetical protein [Candidatus Aminicenantes bacterium]NIM82077.1 hypothetical protein [Candidatus Aminicenantes bacterium]NIN21471.1 hypothetical protein [Candidatus Aminicenantes bacterium]NIN45283.1 hypothetical protein [Candidatus Aminicenantes bacterium]NIN88100.1 hypothetical protein [Candidatus Aminicenantes bacterium]
MNCQNKSFLLWVFLILLWGGLNLQAVVVSTTQELVNAVSSANSGGDKEIVLQNGTYTLDDMLMIWADGVTVRSQSGNRNSVIIQGQGMYGGVSHIFNVAGSNFTVRNMTIGWVANHAIQIWGDNNSSNILISNLRIVDTYEQMVKISYDSSSSNSSENGIMENCLLEYSAGVGPQYYIGGIDGHQCKNWTVRNNTFKNISSPGGDVAEHAVHFWSDSQDTLVENNLIINCDRGIGFGLGNRGHIRGTIRNNMIYHSSTDYGFADVAIGLENAANARVYNNTVCMENTYPNAIEYRFSGTSGGIIKNNLCNKAITSRDGGSADLSNNITNAQAGWFVNVSSGDLHLASQVSQVVDQGVSISGLTGDYDGDSRPQGPGIDIGADEYKQGGSSGQEPPFGAFDTPIDGSTVYSSIPVTGWALDDVAVESVKIYRDPFAGHETGMVYIGDATFVEGARPDIESTFPGYPNNSKAGWGYMMLTNFLPGGGNGTYTIHAKATDAEGHTVTLGSKTITIDNANAVKPFGAIDTPTQGGTASGGNFINWGWVLTPQPNTIPIDGSSIDVIVDGVNIGHPTYNNYRADIAGLFPSYNNSNGAVGYFYLDTTAYANGVHTIQWTAEDNAGNSDGIGSRYFTIQNTGESKVRVAVSKPKKMAECGDRANTRFAPTKGFRADVGVNLVFTRSFETACLWPPISDSTIPIDYSTPVRIKKGYNKNIEPREIYPDNNGIITIEIKELERLEIHFFDNKKSALHLSPLPIGSTLDAARGIFYWSPGPGFLGEYELVFVDISTDGPRRLDVKIKILPKYR